MKKTLFIFLIMLMLCPQAFARKQAQLELRGLQTHLYNTSDKNKVQAAVFSTLQDEGFVITTYEDELGYLTAIRDFKDDRTDGTKVAYYSALLALYGVSTVLSYGVTAPYMIDPAMRLSNELKDKHVAVVTNVLVEPFGKKVKVRMNLVEKVYVYADGYSYIKPAIRSVRQVGNPLVYQNFFNEIDKSLFIEKQKL